MRILIAVPTFETVCPETFKSIWDLDTSGHDVDFLCITGYDCAKARNEIAKRAQLGFFDYVLMVDSDMVLPENTLQCLCEYPGDIILGCYPKKRTKDGCVELFKKGHMDFEEFWYYHELPDNPRLPVMGGGFGCAFIRTELFYKMPFPWFKYVTYENDSVLSEDLYFCDVANSFGFKIEADTRIRCGHCYKDVHYD